MSLPRTHLLAFALITLLAVRFGLLEVSWDGWAPAPCRQSRCFCEALRDGAIVQPSNAYSNLAFVLVGLMVLSAKPGVSLGAVNLMRDRPAYARLYGAAVIAIGLGSLFYHASLSFVGMWFDLMGMYLLITLILLYNLARLRPLPGAGFVLAYLLFNAALGILLIVAPAVRRQVFGGLMLLALAVEALVRLLRRRRNRPGYLILALASFALAYLLWTLDVRGILCAPESLLQGHAVWHVLTAASAGFMFLYYRSEN